MTDNEIIKALEEIKESKTLKQCSSIPNVAKDALDLIKRQQAEIDRLKTENERAKTNIYKMTIDKALAEKARTEAIKEFADRLKSKTMKMMQYDEGGWGCEIYVIGENDIDNLVKEMVGEGNDN